MNSDKKGLYINMIVGTIGMIMVGLGILRYFTLMYDALGYGMGLIGFAFVNSYIYYLEKRAGINNYLIWVQSGVGIVTLAIVSYFVFL